MITTFLLRIESPDPERVRHEITEWAEELAFMTDTPLEDVQVTEHDATD